MARISLLMSYKTLLVVKASFAKDTVNLLRKTTIKLGKLRLDRGRVTKQLAQLRLYSKTNSPSN